MLLPEGFPDYELLDAGSGKKLERWGKTLVIRPEPQAFWPGSSGAPWNEASLVWETEGAKGQWNRALDPWTIKYRDLAFIIKPTGQKQLGLFPEQATNWDVISQSVAKARRPVRVLNVFAYTGGATLAAARGNAEVCHVDASRASVEWAKQNLLASGMGDARVRFIVDDAIKFIHREGRRNSRYDGLILDPPSFGRGPGGERFSLKQSLPSLLDNCFTILTERPLFLVLNVHTKGLGVSDVKELLLTAFARRAGGRVVADQIGLKASTGRILPCGVTGWWTT